MAFNIQGARQAGYSDQEIQQYLASKQSPRGVMTDTEAQATQPKSGGSLLPLLGSILGGVVGAPLGPLGIIGGSAAGGGLGAAVGRGNVLKEGGLGGLGALGGLGLGRLLGPILGKVGLKAATAGEGVAGKVSGLGQTLRKSVVNPKVVPTPFAAEKEAEIAKTVGKYVGGSAQAIRQKSPKVMRELSSQIQQSLAENNPLIDPAIAMKTVQTNLERVAAYDLSDPTFAQAASVQLKKIKSLKTAKDIYGYKQELGNSLGQAFTKLEKGTGLTQREEALMATWRSLDNILTESAPHIKDLTLAQSAFYEAAPGLAQKAKQNINIPFTNIPIPAGGRIAQAGTDILGRGLETGGQVAGKIPIPSISQVAGQAGVRAIGAKEAQAAEPTIPEMPTRPSGQRQQLNLTDILKMAALADLGKGGKNINEIIALSNFLNPPLGAATKTQLQQLTGAQSLVDQLESVYNQASQAGELGPYGKGTLSTLTGRITGGQVAGSATLYDSLRKGFTALIARSTGERGVLTDADAARAMALIPSANTTPQFAARQFAEIRKIFQDAQARIGGAEQWNIPMPANLGL